LSSNASKLPVDSCREGAPHAFHGTDGTFRRSVGQKKRSAIEAIAIQWLWPGAKMEIPVK
jgi:hypothetical protein